MWSLLVSMCLLADAGTPPNGGVELRVWRAASELPREWSQRVPADLDFTAEQLAGGAALGKSVVVVAPRFERHGADLYVWASPRVPEVTRCPPCRGIQTPLDLSEYRELQPVTRPTTLYRLPRTAGRVFELRAVETFEPVRCLPCTAP